MLKNFRGKLDIKTADGDSLSIEFGSTSSNLNSCYRPSFLQPGGIMDTTNSGLQTETKIFLSEDAFYYRGLKVSENLKSMSTWWDRLEDSNDYYLPLLLKVSEMVNNVPIFLADYWTCIPEFVIFYFFFITMYLILRSNYDKHISHILLLILQILFFWSFIILIYSLFIVRFSLSNIIFMNFYEITFYTVLAKLILLVFFIFFLIYVESFNPVISYAVFGNSSFFILILFFFLFSFILPSTVDLFLFFFVIEGITFFTIFFFIYNFSYYTYLYNSIKYFCLNSIASGSLLFSFILLYIIFGSTSYLDILNLIELFDVKLEGLEISYVELPKIFFLSFFFFFLLSGFKLSIAPFAFFLPGFYANLSFHMIFFFGTVFKLVFLLAWAQLILKLFPILSMFSLIFTCFGILSILVGALSAFSQKFLRTFFALSGINHMGFFVLSFGLQTFEGIQFAFLYVLTYFLTNMIIFWVLDSFKFSFNPSLPCGSTVNSHVPLLTISQLSLLRRNPVIAVIFSLAILSFAGFPPTAGFFSKFFLLLHLVSLGYSFLVFFLLLINALSLIYYIRILRIIWIDEKLLSELRLNSLSFFYTLSSKATELQEFLFFHLIIYFFGFFFIWHWIEIFTRLITISVLNPSFTL